MKNVWCYRSKNVRIWEVFPERIDNWLDSSFRTGLQEASWIVVEGVQSGEDGTEIS